MIKTLDSLTVGENATIHDLDGLPEFLSRATSIGFCPGVSITVLQNKKGYPLIVYVNETRIAIDRIEAKKVIIDEHI